MLTSSRRTFLAAPLAAAAAAPPPRERFSANDRIGVGIIGTGGRGKHHLNELTKCKGENIAIVGACDVHRTSLQAYAAKAGPVFGVDKVATTTDYREMLSWKNVDAVIIASPDFNHSEMLTEAVRAGKDVYCEKPMGTVFQDAKRAYLAVKASRQVVQIGTQRRSEPGLMGAAKLMQQGVIGKVTRVDMEVNFHEARWRRDYSDLREADVDWQRFLFGRSDRKFDARRLREWQLFRDYTNGLPGLWMSHYIDWVPWFLGMPYPQSVVANGGIFLWKDGRETEDVFQALFTYPNDCLVRWAMSLTNAAPWRNQWYGTRGTLDADALKVTGDGSKASDKVASEIVIEKVQTDTHMENFFRCMRSRQTPRADIQAGFSHAVAGTMAAEAFRTGRRVTFDPERLEIV